MIHEEFIDPLEDLIRETNNEIIGIIARRIKSFEGLTPTEINKLANLSKTKDLNEIKQLLADLTEKTEQEIQNIFEKSAKENDLLSQRLFEAKNIPQATYLSNKQLKSILERFMSETAKKVLNLSKTRVFVIDGKVTDISKAYTNVINRAIYQSSQGLVDYKTAMRRSIKELAQSGMQIVESDTGYTRRLDSQVRMNILDGLSQMNMAYYEQQGEEFSADGYEISAHALCAEDHLHIQGKQYTKEQYKAINSSLVRPIGTMNCRHVAYPILIGISEPAYTSNELNEIANKSTEQVTYTDLLGEKKAVTRYQATQRQRQIETQIRRLKDEKYALEQMGDAVGARETQKKITEKVKYYKKMSNEVGLSPKLDRISTSNPN